MSRFSERILSSIDYSRVKSIRETNFRLLHEMLGDVNRLQLQPESIPGPYCYPLWTGSSALREKVIASQVFAPMLWEEVLGRLPDGQMVEASFVKAIVPLPVDQRYGQRDMERIADVVRGSL